jgi:hypothetical protein
VRWFYTSVAVGLILFGFVGLLSIGAPFLLTGLVMLVCYPWRHRHDILWPSLASVWGLALGYLLVAPLGCASWARGTPAGVVSDSGTTCDGLLLRYSGDLSYNPPLLPALMVGLAAALTSAIVVRLLTHRSGAPAEELPVTPSRRSGPGGSLR